MYNNLSFEPNNLVVRFLKKKKNSAKSVSSKYSSTWKTHNV